VLRELYCECIRKGGGTGRFFQCPDPRNPSKRCREVAAADIDEPGAGERGGGGGTEGGRERKRSFIDSQVVAQGR
jgi:hypothetical protein